MSVSTKNICQLVLPALIECWLKHTNWNMTHHFTEQSHKYFYTHTVEGHVREFISNKPVFLTSDLEHHFKYHDKIEVTSEDKSMGPKLTANFFFTEIEAFRQTTSRDFLNPPDESSKPHSDDWTSSPTVGHTTTGT